MSLQLRSGAGVVAEDELFVVDVIDLLQGEAEEMLYLWDGEHWRSPDGASRTQLELEPTDPEATVEVRFRDLATPALELTHSWSGKGALAFEPGPDERLQLIALASGERLASLDRERGIWSASVPGSFDKIFFSAKAPARSRRPERRERLAAIAERA